MLLVDGKELILSYIIGAGGFAAELYTWLEADNLHEGISAFVTETAYAGSHDVGFTKLPVLTLAEVPRNQEYYLGISDPILKRKFFEQLSAIGWNALQFISKNAIVSVHSHIGQGAVICPFTTISPLSVLGKLTTINCHSGVGHHARIGDFSTLLGQNSVNGHAVVGDYCTLGSGAQILPRCKIGNGSTVGIGSVVISNIKDNQTVFGNPAKKIIF